MVRARAWDGEGEDKSSCAASVYAPFWVRGAELRGIGGYKAGSCCWEEEGCD